jgi:methionine synthase II (cobalamin-independent)
MFDIFGTRAMRKEIELLAQQVLDLTAQVETLQGDLAAWESTLDDRISEIDFTELAEDAINSAVDNATLTVRF